MAEFILIGQPNCGKSTIFNEVAGYKTIASNFPGVSVEFTKSEIDFKNEKFDLVDLPGLYSSQTTDEAELVTVKYVREKHDDAVLINIIDASVLSRSLELTLQIASLKRPMVIGLNMIDEARAKGMKIDFEKLEEIFGVPVVPTVGRKGEGVFELFEQAFNISKSKKLPNEIDFDKLEPVLKEISDVLAKEQKPYKFSKKFLALKLLEKDSPLKEYLQQNISNIGRSKIDSVIAQLESREKKESEFVVSATRHDLAFTIFKKCAVLQHTDNRDIRTKIDDVLMHPVFGYFFMGGLLYSMFFLIFTFGNFIEPYFLDNIALLTGYFENLLGSNTLAFTIIHGVIEGFGGGLGIVVPYLLPFFIFLAVLEDSGYLARIAYLIDNFMHRIGLHGLSVIPIILGYGCTVPGILATRILKSPTDKFITATLTTLVPCSARMTIIFGLVGFFISIKAAIIIYILNLIIMGITGKIMSKAMDDVSSGLILEIPRYHMPGFKAFVGKTWFRLREFVLLAWPILIIGSIVLEVINFYNLTPFINNFLEPFTTGVLGLPAVIGVTLLFGIMRKELALILLFTAIGTKEVLTVLTYAQVFSFTLFVTFYVPCLATIAALAKELGWKKALVISIITAGLAVILAVAARFIVPVFGI